MRARLLAKSVLVSALLCFITPMTGFAQSTSINNKEFPLDVGLAFTLKQSPYVGGDTLLGISPRRLDHSGYNFPGPAWALLKRQDFRLYVGVGLDGWPTDREDLGMPDLDRAINLRLGGAWKMGSGVMTAEVGHDVAGAHSGAQAKARYTYNPAPYKSTFRPYLEMQWMSEDMTDYYVGVGTEQATASRLVYEAGAAQAIKLGVDIERPLTKKITLVGGVEMTHFGSEITDSPLIDRDAIWATSLGVVYRWR